MTLSLTVRSIKIIYTVCPVTAIVFTLFRLFLRARTASLWWDDWLAFMAAIFTALTSCAGWMHFSAEALPLRSTKIGAYYLVAESFYGSIWCARLSILYSIIRIASSPRMRKFLYGLGIGMALAWIVLAAQIFWVCEPLTKWKKLPEPQCHLPLQVAIVQIVADVLSDLFLIAVPARLFLNSKLEAGTKFRLVVIFSASLLTTLVSLVHVYYLLHTGGVDVLVAAIVEVAVSVIVCNLSVVVTSASRLCTRKSFAEDTTEREASHVRTFGQWSPRKSKKQQSELTTIGLSSINVKKESETYIDMEGAKVMGNAGQLETKGTVVYYETADQATPKKGVLP